MIYPSVLLASGLAALGGALGGAGARRVLSRAPRGWLGAGHVVAGALAYAGGGGLGVGIGSLLLTGVGDSDVREGILAVEGAFTANVATLAYALAAGATFPVALPPARAWGGAVGVVAGGLLVSAAWTTFVSWLGPTVQQDALQFVGGRIATDILSFALLFIVVGAPVAEELVFRGLAYDAFCARFGRPVAVGASATLFGLLHAADPLAVPPIVVLGLLLGDLRARSGSVLPGVLAHAVYNAVGAAALLSGGAPPG